MSNNLQMYHKVLKQLCQWLPSERITRLRNMALLLVGMQQAGGIHLSLIVRKWPGLASKEMSLVNRLRRFLDNQRVGVRTWYEPVLKLIVAGWRGGEMRLIMDCTKVGFHFRLLTISVAYKKRALPLVWSVHRGRKGHVGYQAQLALLTYLARFVPAETTVWLLADAGFESVQLLDWLTGQGWHFVLRHPGKNQVRWEGQPWLKLRDIAVSPGETHFIGWVHLTAKHDAGPFWLIIHWEQGEDEPWYLFSDVSGQRPLINRYRLRMWTEEMYGDMKGHGFDIESTHLDDAHRISRLFLAVCLNFVWFITLGAWVVKRGLRHYVDHKSRRDKSYFRIGWDWLERCARLGKPIPIRFKPLF